MGKSGPNITVNKTHKILKIEHKINSDSATLQFSKKENNRNKNKSKPIKFQQSFPSQ